MCFFLSFVLSRFLCTLVVAWILNLGQLISFGLLFLLYDSCCIFFFACATCCTGLVSFDWQLFCLSFLYWCVFIHLSCLNLNFYFCFMICPVFFSTCATCCTGLVCFDWPHIWVSRLPLDRSPLRARSSIHLSPFVFFVGILLHFLFLFSVSMCSFSFSLSFISYFLLLCELLALSSTPFFFSVFIWFFALVFCFPLWLVCFSFVDVGSM